MPVTDMGLGNKIGKLIKIPDIGWNDAKFR
jgi:hypothetical protein